MTVEPFVPPEVLITPVENITLQAIVHTATGEIQAVGLFPSGVDDPSMEVVTFPESDRAALEAPGEKVLNSNGTITVTPPAPRPVQTSNTFTIREEVTTTNNVATTLYQYPLPQNTGYDILLYVYGVDRGTGNLKKFRREAMIRRLSGAPTVIGTVETPRPDVSDAAAAGWTMVPTFVGNNLVIRVTGVNGVTIDWTLFAEVRQFSQAGV